MQDQAKTSGLTFTTPDGKQQAAFTSSVAQFNNSQYLATQAFSDAKTRTLYSSHAAISLQEMGLAGGAKFGVNTAQGFAVGVPEGAMDSLKSYASLLDTETYSKLVGAVKVMMADPTGTMNKLATSLQGQAQDAAIGIYIDWLQKDSAALGESAGKIYGGVLVDMALTAVGAKAAGLAVDSAEQLSKALASKVKSLDGAKSLDIATSPKIDLVPRVVQGSNLIVDCQLLRQGWTTVLTCCVPVLKIMFGRIGWGINPS